MSVKYRETLKFMLLTSPTGLKYCKKKNCLIVSYDRENPPHSRHARFLAIDNGITRDRVMLSCVLTYLQLDKSYYPSQ